MSVILAFFHLSGAMVMSGAATNNLNSYPLLILGKVLAAIGDGSLDNAQHRIFSTYFAPGRGFAFSIGSFNACQLLLLLLTNHVVQALYGRHCTRCHVSTCTN